MRGLAALGFLAISPQVASAHLVTTGLGPFYDGVSHLALTPEDLLPVLALSMLAGLRGPRFGRLALALLPTAWLAGGVAGLSHEFEVFIPLVPLISCLLLGALLAVNPDLHIVRLGGLTAIVGLLHGYQNGTTVAQAGLGMLGLLGIGVSLFVAVALGAALAIAARGGWQRTAVRTAGGFVAAGGVLFFQTSPLSNGWWGG